MILYLGESKGLTRRWLVQWRQFREVVWRVNTHKSIVVLCSNNGLAEKEYVRLVPFNNYPKVEIPWDKFQEI